MNKQIRADTGICHLRVDRETGLSDFLLQCDLHPLEVRPDTEVIREWLHYGSVYVDGTRVREDMRLQPQQIIRLHTRRKSYVARDVRLRDRVVFENEDFVVLDKPAGLPTHATLDNYIENAAYLLSQELGQRLFVTHRLDIATSGLLVLAKSKESQAGLNKLFAKGKVTKIYRAFTDGPIPLGLHVHYMNPESRVPKELCMDRVEGWWECRLEVLESARANEQWLSTIRLLTGKTHQIRAQLSFLGQPILGDSDYGSTQIFSIGGIGLQCAELHFVLNNRPYGIKAGSTSRPFGK